MCLKNFVGGVWANLRCGTVRNMLFRGGQKRKFEELHTMLVAEYNEINGIF